MALDASTTVQPASCRARRAMERTDGSSSTTRMRARTGRAGAASVGWSGTSVLLAGVHCQAREGLCCTKYGTTHQDGSVNRGAALLHASHFINLQKHAL